MLDNSHILNALIHTFVHYLLMIDVRKNSLKYLSYAWVLPLLLLITSSSFANYPISSGFDNSLTPLQDTVPVQLPDSLLRDTVPNGTDSLVQVVDSFSVKLSKDSLSSPVSYKAMDSMVLNIPDKRIILYSQANVTMDDMDLSADSIILDQQDRMLIATYRLDTLGNIIGKPKMIQGETNMDADVIRYNLETQKGMTLNTFTQQGEIFIQGERIKKISVSEFFALRGQFTTCNLDVPHFAFRTKKLKLVSQKLAVSGPVHPEFEGVPVPIYLPFGLFPISQGRHSGFLPPRFSAVDQYGLGLQGLGYYKVLNDYFDATIRGDIYSYGGWALNFTPTYRVRYRYNGSMNLALQKTRILSNDPREEFSTTNTFNITWAHVVDSKARPGTSFSANVNAGSTKFNSFVVDNPMRNFNNRLTSHVTYSKTWDAYNLTMSATHNQNNNTGIVNMSLPNLAFTANTFYPFQEKDYVGPQKWYHKLGIGLNSNVSNRLSFYDSAFSVRRILDTLQWGATHNIPIQVSLPPVGPVQIAPGISFSERWYSSRLTKGYNPQSGKIDSVVNKGFYAEREMSFSLSMNTAIFGMFDKFGKNSSVRAIRHVIRPNVSMSYKPDMNKDNWYRAVVDSLGRTREFSYYEGSIPGSFSQGEFGGISFGIDNNIEMKVRNKKDTAEGAIKKIRLIDGFGVNGGYNMLADSFALSNFNLYIRSTLFEKINITAGGMISPYQVDETGDRINRYAWQGGKFSPGQLMNGNIAISTSFRSKPKDEKKEEELEAFDESLPPMTMEEQMAQMDYIRQNPAEFADFNIPWSLNLSYSLNFSRIFRGDYSGFETVVNSNLSWNGDFNLTPKWKLGMNGYFDFKTTSIQSMSMFISREMHCWQLSINVTPVGLWRSFNISINPKSGLLRDLKINRNRTFRN